MKNSVIIGWLLAILASCGVTDPQLQLRVLPASEQTHTNLHKEPENRPSETPKTPSPQFIISADETQLLGLAERSGGITILNYPFEWHGHISVIRYHGIAPDDGQPFSADFCKKMRILAKYDSGVVLLRSAYATDLSFDLPMFISSSFPVIARKAAESAGLNLPDPSINNGFVEMAGKIELSFSEKAITPSVGDLENLKQQLNFGSMAYEDTDPKKRTIGISAGDLLCDLISGDATVTMHYPVRGENRSVKLFYGRPKIKLRI